jgi:hypothetical protein
MSILLKMFPRRLSSVSLKTHPGYFLSLIYEIIRKVTETELDKRKRDGMSLLLMGIRYKTFEYKCIKQIFCFVKVVSVSYCPCNGVSLE